MKAEVFHKVGSQSRADALTAIFRKDYDAAQPARLSIQQTVGAADNFSGEFSNNGMEPRLSEIEGKEVGNISIPFRRSEIFQERKLS